ncbi:MAG TPA: OmpA family protein [Actinomycetales bacterium]|nr:OmpA family protein [Actinomycetales bacterium]
MNRTIRARDLRRALTTFAALAATIAGGLTLAVPAQAGSVDPESCTMQFTPDHLYGDNAETTTLSVQLNGTWPIPAIGALFLPDGRYLGATSITSGEVGTWSRSTVAGWASRQDSVIWRTYSTDVADYRAFDPNSLTVDTPYLCQATIRVVAPPANLRFEPIADLMIGDTARVVTVSDSDAPTTIISTNPSACSYGDGQVTINEAGPCILQATQAPTDTHAGAQVTLTVTVLNPEFTTLEWPDAGWHRLGEAPFTLTPTSNSPAAITVTSTTPAVCSYTDGKVTLLSAGTCGLHAEQPAVRGYYSASRDTYIGVSKAASDLALAPVGDHEVGDTPFPLTTTSSSTGEITIGSTNPSVCLYTGGQVTLFSAGTCELTARQDPDANYEGGTATTSFTVSTAPVVAAPSDLSFAPIGDHQVGDDPFSVTVTSSSDADITVTSSTPDVCTYADGQVTPIAAGSCELTASQGGTAQQEAGTATTSFTVTAAPAPPVKEPTTLKLTGPKGLALSAKVSTYTLTSTSPAPTTVVSLAPKVCGIVGSSIMLRAAGTCVVRATQESDATHEAPTAATITFPVWASPAMPKSGHATQVVKVLGPGETGLRVRTSGSCVASGGILALTRVGTCTVSIVDKAGRTVRRAVIKVGYAPTRSRATTMSKATTVTFAYRSAKLTTAAKRSLRAAAPGLRKAAVVTVYGNTYGPGKNSSANVKLSQQRANAVATYLRSLGVKVRITSVGSASHHPISATAAKNRRADVFFLR